VRFLTRAGLSGVVETLPVVPRLRGCSPADRAQRLAGALDSGGLEGHTTNVTVLDAAGSACVLTTSLGLGSGDFVPRLDLHLNSMLGEADLIREPLEPGARMGSMMAPSVALDKQGVALAIGAAGGTRLRGALIQVAAAILDEGLDPPEAVDRPRLHPIGRLVHLEPGFEPDVAPALEAAGYEVRVWPAKHHYFGGVSAVTRDECAGDPRRSGTAAAVNRP
jgi:gamma-glutamyltranspeptidase/glutathione hydrolase